MRPACRGEVAHAAAAATHLHEGERGGMEDLEEQLWNRGGEEEGEVSPDPVAEVTRLGKGHLPSGAVAGEEEDTTRQGRSLRPTRRGGARATATGLARAGAVAPSGGLAAPLQGLPQGPRGCSC